MIEDSQNLLMLERDEELRNIHKRIVSESGINRKYLTREFVVAQIQKCGAPRFYISEHVACGLVTAHYNRKKTHQAQHKRDMVDDLVHVYEEVRNAFPAAQRGEIWKKVVEHPAKSFYLSPARIMEIIFQYHDRKIRK